MRVSVFVHGGLQVQRCPCLGTQPQILCPSPTERNLFTFNFFSYTLFQGVPPLEGGALRFLQLNLQAGFDEAPMTSLRPLELSEPSSLSH